jgi:hypothetical protein
MSRRETTAATQAVRPYHRCEQPKNCPKDDRLPVEYLLESPFSRTWFRNYIPGDINADGTVNILDLMILAASWQKQAGQRGYDLRADLNGDNRVDVFDLQIMAAHWGNN